ncbi:hypothetical protein EV687_1764 [Corticibacter populi]|nr:hypothetical protein EV687_1764 [Corticibacter populi]
MHGSNAYAMMIHGEGRPAAPASYQAMKKQPQTC